MYQCGYSHTEKIGNYRVLCNLGKHALKLATCGFGGIYAADPFDAFLLLCMLTCDPLGSYSDVMEAAYTQQESLEGGRDAWTTQP